MSEHLITLSCPHCHRKNRMPVQRLSQDGKCGACKQPLFTATPLALSDSSFATHASADLPLVVDFWAPWCGPCRQFAPVFEAAARSMEPAVRLAKVNTEEESALAARFAIRSIPTLMIFRAGQEIARVSGALPPEQFSQWVAQSLR
jgi:thioredoxin 2